jgi:hypothetical protein
MQCWWPTYRIKLGFGTSGLLIMVKWRLRYKPQVYNGPEMRLDLTVKVHESAIQYGPHITVMWDRKSVRDCRSTFLLTKPLIDPCKWTTVIPEVLQPVKQKTSTSGMRRMCSMGAVWCKLFSGYSRILSKR